MEPGSQTCQKILFDDDPEYFGVEEGASLLCSVLKASSAARGENASGNWGREGGYRCPWFGFELPGRGLGQVPPEDNLSSIPLRLRGGRSQWDVASWFFSGKMVWCSLEHVGKAPMAICIHVQIKSLSFSLSQVEDPLAPFVKAAVGPLSAFFSSTFHLF